MNNEKILSFNGIHHDFKTDKIILSETVEVDGKVKKTKKVFPVENFYYVKDHSGNSTIRDMFGTPMVRKVAKDRWALKDLAASGTYLCESDVPAAVKFLHERYEGMNLSPKIDNYNIAFLDIELASGKTFTDEDRENTVYPINLITVKFSKSGERYTFGSEPYDGLNNYYWIPDEKLMLTEFIKLFRKNKPDVVTGWYSDGFDIPYILNRSRNVLGIEESLSWFSEDQFDKYRKKWTIPGVAQLDYMNFFQDMKFKQERLPSYKLNAIGISEVGEGKLELDGELNTIYKTDWKKFVDYNIQDVLLVEKLDKKNKFIDLAINICHTALIPFENVFSAMAIVEGVVMSHIHSLGIVAPNKKKVSGEDFEGGYVEAHEGYYKLLASLDATSLYPSVMISGNFSPETLVLNPPEHMKKDLTRCAITDTHGVYFKKTPGIIPSALKIFSQKRKEYKELKLKYEAEGNKELAEFYDNQQKIMKVLNNSFYGVSATPGFRFYNLNIAEATTAGGRALITYMRDCIHDFFHNRFSALVKIYPNMDTSKNIKGRICHLIDTDSLYMDMSQIKQAIAPDMPFVDFVNDFNQKVFKKMFKKKLDQHFDEVYGVANIIEFKLEKIISQMIIFGKKNYATEVLSNEGVIYDKPKLTIAGFASKRSDRPLFCRKKLDDVIRLFFSMEKKDKAVITKELRNIKKEFFQKPIEDISKPTGVKDYKKYDRGFDYFDKHGFVFLDHTPIHNRAAMVYNYIVRKTGMTRELVVDSTKIRYVYIDPRNKYGTNVVGYIGNYPEEFKSFLKVDYETQFDKTFLAAVQIIFDSLGWGKIDLYYEDDELVE